MSEQWPAWARQDEAPIAVASGHEYPRRPDGRGYTIAIYADGTVLAADTSRKIPCLTPEEVRQTHAAMEFPNHGEHPAIWHLARQVANARRDAAIMEGE